MNVPPRMRRAPGAAGRRPGSGHAPLRLLGEQAFSRAAGAPLVGGNRLELLRDATENYPSWLEAIAAARWNVALEAYILADDRVGNQFAEALTAAARRGVRVRVIQDWVGGWGEASRAFWRRLDSAGVEVRCFNPFRIGAPLAVLRRNHRKSLLVDGRVGFVSGLCIAERWAGVPERGIPAWRDTGIALEGPAIADLARAFARAWAETGAPVAAEELAREEDLHTAGDCAVRVIATEPATSSLYRLDQLIAATSRHRLWLTDAYFVGVPSYVEALRAAALDGVDVRLLGPGTSDLGLVKRLGTAGYRPLLEAGIRVFEWDGPMLHAKTAVADGRWSRVGSTNLNLASWMGNWELDVAVEDAGFAREMELAFEADLGNATEIVLGVRRSRARREPQGIAGRHRRREGSAVAAAGAVRLGNTVGAALGGYRALGPAEATLLLFAGASLLGIAALALVVPWLVLAPVVVVLTWLGVALIFDSVKVRRASADEFAETEEAHDDPPASSGTSA